MTLRKRFSVRRPPAPRLASACPAACLCSRPSPAPAHIHRSYFFNGYLFFYICQYAGRQDPTPGTHARATRTGTSSSKGWRGGGGPVSAPAPCMADPSESAASLQDPNTEPRTCAVPRKQGSDRTALPALQSGQVLLLITGSGCPGALSPSPRAPVAVKCCRCGHPCSRAL